MVWNDNWEMENPAVHEIVDRANAQNCPSVATENEETLAKYGVFIVTSESP